MQRDGAFQFSNTAAVLYVSCSIALDVATEVYSNLLLAIDASTGAYLWNITGASSTGRPAPGSVLGGGGKGTGSNKSTLYYGVDNSFYDEHEQTPAVFRAVNV